MPQRDFVANVFPTSWGYVGIITTEQGLVRIVLPHRSKKEVEREIRRALGTRGIANLAPTSSRRALKTLETAEQQIIEYLAGKRTAFDLTLAPPKATDFTRSVWRACCEIPYGETRSYHWIASQIGRRKASRAVGMALGANPLPLIVPCHRVVRSDGSLGGFGGGLNLKRRLLKFERACGARRSCMFSQFR